MKTLRKVVAALSVMFVVGLFCFRLTHPPETVEVTFYRLKRTELGSKENPYFKNLVYTDKETFENTNSLVFLKFNSEEVPQVLVEGETYKFRVCDYQVPFFSCFRNVLSIEHVDHGN